GLPALVAGLRAVVTDPTQAVVRREAAAAELARLAAAGVPGADPDEWWGLAPLSDDRPLRAADEPVPVSPSRVEAFAECELRWLLETAGGTSGRSASQSLGMLVHEIAALAETPGSTGRLAARLDAAWGGVEVGGP